MKDLLARLWQEEKGQDLVEYGLILALLALTIVSTMSKLGSTIKNVFSNTAGNLSAS